MTVAIDGLPHVMPLNLIDALPNEPEICFVAPEQGIGDSVGAVLRRGKDKGQQPTLIAESQLAEWLMGSASAPAVISG